MTEAMHDKILAYKKEKGKFPGTVIISPKQFAILAKEAVGEVIVEYGLFSVNYHIKQGDSLQGEDMLFED